MSAQAGDGPLASKRLRQSRQSPAAHPNSALLNLVLVLIESARRRSGSVRAVFIKRAAVAGTHEQVRLLEPSHRAPEMRAIDREDLKLLPGKPSHPTGDVCRFAVPRPSVWIAIRRQTGLIFRKIFQRTEQNPRLRRFPTIKAGEDISNHRNGQQGRGRNIERGPKREEKTTTGYSPRRDLRRFRFIRRHSFCYFLYLF